MMIRFLIITFIMMTSVASVYAADWQSSFTVYVNGEPQTKDDTISPCFPLNVSFAHPNSAVSIVRLEYPLDTSKFFLVPADDKTHLKFFENFMRDGLHPYIDFIAEDEGGQQYGRIRMTFLAPEDPEQNDCGAAIS